MSNQQYVWVAYATQTQQFHIRVAFQQGMTAWQAIESSGLLAQVELPQPYHLGIFGMRCVADRLLEAGDRVEIYRPLTINPKDIRRKRAEKNPVGRFQKGNRFK